jgi:hypothetical protein
MTQIDPKACSRAALNTVRSHPSLLFWRVLGEFMSSVVRAGTALLLGLFMTVVVVVSLRTGPGLSTALKFFLRPDFVFGALGLGFTAWLFGFALDAYTWGGVWKSTARVMSRERLRFFSDASESFPRALWQRAMILLHDLGIVALFGTTVMATIALTSWLDSNLFASAAIWGAALTLYVALAVLIRFTASVAAAGMFIEGRSWPDAWLSAAETVVQNPVAFYRIFVLSAYALIPPLIFYYIVIFFYNFTVGTALAPLGEVARLFGELLMMIGFAGFLVLTQMGFFNAYATSQSLAELPAPAPKVFGLSMANKPPTLSELLPAASPYKVNVDTLPGIEPLGERKLQAEDQTPANFPTSSENDDDSTPKVVDSEPAEKVTEPAQGFDLDSVLRPSEKPSENEDI